MLDLNVEIISSDPLPFGDEKVLVVAKEEDRDVEEEEEKAKQLIGGAGGSGRGRREEEEEQHSVGTSDSSSVVNDEESLASAGDENSSSAAPVAFVFDVFKKDQDESTPRPDQLATRQLFPVPEGGEAELGLEPIAAVTAPRTQWLKLSSAGSGCRESGGPLMTGKLKSLQPQKQQQQVRKSRRGPRSRSSQYRGVTFYRRTGRWESHIWDCGKQVYLGGFDTAYAAARAYDRAAMKFRGADADINFSISDYEEDMKQMGNLTKEEFIHVLRRQGTGVSRGNPKSRGMGLQKCGPWDARMGQFIGAHGIVDSQYNSREAMADLRHGGYECEVALEASHEGSGGGHHLDLNLGMAPPSAADPKKIKVVGNYRASSRDWKARGGELPMVGCSDISATNKRPPVWPAMYPFLLPSSEGKAVEKKRGAEAPTRSNIGWQMGINGNHGGTSTSPSMPLVFSSNAASSGFSPSSSSSSSSSARHLHHISAAPQNPNSQLLMKPSSNNVNPFPFYRFRV